MLSTKLILNLFVEGTISLRTAYYGGKMDELIKKALEELIENEDTDLYMELLQQMDIHEPAFAEAALKKEIFYPALLYKDASTKVRDELIHRLDKELSEEEIDTLDINGMLLALSAIGDERVVETFQRWEKNPPKWREKVYVGPMGYATEGGWCIENGTKKNLSFDVCYAIEKQENYEEDQSVYGGLSEEKCPYCESKYVDISSLDGTDERFSFLGVNGKLKIKTCLSCICYGGFIFCKYDENGESKIVYQEDGYGDELEDEDLELEADFVISQKPVSPYHCAECEESAIGGVAQFVDDASYAICPECGKRMKHFAQLGEEYTGCGTIYVQICPECRIAATSFQQT